MDQSFKHRTVVTFSQACARTSVHEQRRNEALARKLAEINRWDFAGDYREDLGGEPQLYFVPYDTIVGIAFAQRLGIRSAEDLFGGVVAYGLFASKAILHGLARPESKRPFAWPDAFARAIDELTLPGYTVFSPHDGIAAARRLLKLGHLRVKDAFAKGGNRQVVVQTPEELECQLNSGVPSDAYVLETNLNPVATLTVGEVRVGDVPLSYYGTQRTTQDHRGAIVYGGTDCLLSAEASGGFCATRGC